MHYWSKKDNDYVITNFINHCQTTDYDWLISRMASHIGTTKNAIKQKLANMLYIITNGQKGLSNYSQDSRSAVFDFLEQHPQISIAKLQFLLS